MPIDELGNPNEISKCAMHAIPGFFRSIFFGITAGKSTSGHIRVIAKITPECRHLIDPTVPNPAGD
jgi:hypothetical protein